MLIALGIAIKKYWDTRRAAAIAALLLPPLLMVLAVVVMLQEFPRVLIVSGLLLIAMAAVWYALLRQGAARALGFAVGILALAATVTVLVNNGDHVGVAIVIVAGLALAGWAAKAALSYSAASLIAEGVGGIRALAQVAAGHAPEQLHHDEDEDLISQTVRNP